MRYAEMDITPEISKEWLRKNKVNRQINIRRAKQYAYDMTHGKWQLNGEAIKIYEDGTLADGQHRLTGVVMSGITVKMCVIFDVPRDTTIQDRGRNRSTTDSLLLEGYSKDLANKDLVAVAKLHYSVIKNTPENVSDGMVKDFLLRNEEILMQVSVLRGYRKKNRAGKVISITAPILLAVFYALNAKACDMNCIKSFVDVLVTGIPDSLSQSAALVCRNDILSGAIPIGRGTTDRIIATHQIEKSIADFIDGYPRKITYANWKTPIYSCLEVNKEA